MISLVALAESTTAVPGFPRLSSRLSPFLTAAMLRYMPYVNGPHHRPPTTTTASTTRVTAGRAWMARMPVPSGRKARHITPKTIQQVRDIFCTVTTGCLPGAVDGSSADGMRSGWVAQPDGLDAGGELMGDQLGPPPKWPGGEPCRNV